MSSKDRSYLRVLESKPASVKSPAVDPDSLMPLAMNVPPDWFDEAQRATWAELLSEVPVRLLPEIDRSTFTTLVVAKTCHQDAATKVAKFGAVVKSPGGHPIQSPYVAIMNKQATIMLRASSELGLTMASRARVKAGSKTPPGRGVFADLKKLGDD